MMRLNPIIKKDIRVQARSMRICWGVFAYELILALVFFLAMIIIRQENVYSNENIYSALVWLYPVLAVTQLLIIGVVVPVRTASAISGEKERQTFDIMMTTSMTPFSIIWGKVLTAIVQNMFFVVASMPIMALTFVIGGMSWGYLFVFLGMALLMSFFAASIGILCSSLCKKSISAVIMSYIFYLFFFIATFVPYIIYQVVAINMSYSYSGTSQSYTSVWENLSLFLLLNPGVYMVEIFGRIMTGDSMVDSIPSGQGTNLVDHVVVGNRWVIISSILFVVVSMLFLWLASKRINPIKSRGKKRAEKQSS